MLRRENERLLAYIGACRVRFGDAAVNAAIMDMCPPEPVRNPMTEENARQLFEAVRRLHSPDSALANDQDQRMGHRTPKRGTRRRARNNKMNTKSPRAEDVGSPAKQAGAFPPVPGSLSAAVAEWDQIVPKKWAELRDAKGHFIAVFTPQVGHREDLRRRRDTTQQVMRWTVEWFAQRGHDIECVLDDDGESFGIREANTQVRDIGGDALTQSQPVSKNE